MMIPKPNAHGYYLVDSWSPAADLPRTLVSEVPEGPVTVVPPPKKADDA